MRLLLVVAVVGCTRDTGRAPKDATTVPVPVRIDAALADAPPIDAPPIDAPTDPAISLVGVPLSGPYPTRAAACAVRACPATFPSGTAEPPRPMQRSCNQPDGDKMSGLLTLSPPPPFQEAELMAISCRIVGETHDGSDTFHAIVRRADGYWATPPLVTIGGNSKYCDGSIDATWKKRDLTAAGGGFTLAVKAHTNCLSCGKQGFDDQGIDLLIGIADGPKPVVFPPLEIGRHSTQKKADWFQPSLGGEDCKAINKNDVMKLDWRSDKRLVVTGPALWPSILVDDDGISVIKQGIYEGTLAPSSAGIYRFVMP